VHIVAGSLLDVALRITQEVRLGVATLLGFAVPIVLVLLSRIALLLMCVLLTRVAVLFRAVFSLSVAIFIVFVAQLFVVQHFFVARNSPVPFPIMLIDRLMTSHDLGFWQNIADLAGHLYYQWFVHRLTSRLEILTVYHQRHCLRTRRATQPTHPLWVSKLAYT
jgi:hypothetical protein